MPIETRCWESLGSFLVCSSMQTLCCHASYQNGNFYGPPMPNWLACLGRNSLCLLLSCQARESMQNGFSVRLAVLAHQHAWRACELSWPVIRSYRGPRHICQTLSAGTRWSCPCNQPWLVAVADGQLAAACIAHDAVSCARLHQAHSQQFLFIFAASECF